MGRVGNDETRVRRIAEDVMQSSIFSFRGPGILPGTEPGVWLLRLWYKEERAAGVSITITDQSTDESIRQDLATALEGEAGRLEG